MAHRILVVDDDAHIREVICLAVRKAGMVVAEARDGSEALAKFAREQPSLIVLDIGMPELDGLDVCREIRKTSDVPILFLSARDDEIDRVLGLEIGGDDYVTKPFSPRELVLRVGAILRRARGEASTRVTEVGPIRIDRDRHEVTIDGEHVELTPTEYKLLTLLAQRRGRLQGRAELLEQVWDASPDIQTRTVDMHVQRLRAKLGDAGDLIETVRGFGYRIRSDAP